VILAAFPTELVLQAGILTWIRQSAISVWVPGVALIEIHGLIKNSRLFCVNSNLIEVVYE
jgi:hypothetical protein